MTDDDIELPPLPEPMWPEYGLSRAYSDAYSERQMQDFARAAILADRAARAPQKAEPSDAVINSVLWQAYAALQSCDAQHPQDGGRQWYDEKAVDDAIKALTAVLAAPPPPAPQKAEPPTPPADAQITVEVERGRVWIKRGNQSWILAYDDDDPVAVEWYAKTLRAALEGK